MRTRGAIAFGTALIASLCIGLWLGGHPAKLPAPLRDVFVGGEAGLHVEATEAIEDNYFRQVHGNQLSNSSLQGMVKGLRLRYHDRFSDYFSPENLKSFNEEISGRFSGIGLVVAEVKRGLRATHVYKGSPADEAGIKAGEVVVSANGHSLAGVESEAAAAMIKGPEGTQVAVGVLEPKSGKVRRLKITRAEIALPVATGTVKKLGRRRLGYVRLTTFSEGSDAYLRKAVEKVYREGAEGVVLDLRDNGGGLLEEAVLSASIWLPKGEVVVTTKSRTEGDSVYKALGGNLPAKPLVVLINRNTASAAEILTAALADDAGATVVGTRSYGKGVFQQEISLSNGGAMKLTVGEYFTPNGENLARTHGIHPEVEVQDNPATKQDEALQKALRTLAGKGQG